MPKQVWVSIMVLGIYPIRSQTWTPAVHCKNHIWDKKKCWSLIVAFLFTTGYSVCEPTAQDVWFSGENRILRWIGQRNKPNVQRLPWWATPSPDPPCPSYWQAIKMDYFCVGLFHICKLPCVNTLTTHHPETMDLAFKLKRKKFSIEVRSR